MSGQLQATDVTYMRLSGDRGWQKHAKLHSVAFTAASHDGAVLTVAEAETQRQRECLSLPRDIVQASLNGGSTLRLTARGTPLRKIALTFASAGELDLFAKRIHAITRVRGIEQLPGPSLTAEAAMAAQTEPLPDLSAPVVQAYAARLLFDDRFHEFVCQLGEFFCGLTARLPASTASAAAAASGSGFAVAQGSGQKRRRGAESGAADDNDTHDPDRVAAAAAAAAAGGALDSTAAASGITAGQQSTHSESVLQPRSLMNSVTMQRAQMPATPISAAQPSSSTAAHGRAAAPTSVTPAAGYMPAKHSVQQQQQQQQQLVNHHRAAAAAAVTPAPEAELTPPDAVRSSVRGAHQSNGHSGANSAAGSAAVTRVHSPRAVYPQQQQQQLAEAQRQQARMQHAAQQHQQQQQQQRQYQHQLQLQQQQQQLQRQLQQQQFMRPQSVSEAQQAQRRAATQPAMHRAAVPAAAAAAVTDDNSTAAAPPAKRKRGRPAAKNAVAAAATADSQASVVSVAAAVPSVRKSVAERFSTAVVGGRTPRGERAALYAELKSLWEAVYVLEDCWPFRKPVKPSTPGYKVSL
jgi:hypothetical protein